MAPAGSCFEVTVKLQSRVTYKPAFTCHIHGTSRELLWSHCETTEQGDLQASFHLPHPWPSGEMLLSHCEITEQGDLQASFHLPHPWPSGEMLLSHCETTEQGDLQASFHLLHPWPSREMLFSWCETTDCCRSKKGPPSVEYFVCVCMCVCVCVCLCVCVHACVLCVHVCLHVCVLCSHTHTHTHTTKTFWQSSVKIPTLKQIRLRPGRVIVAASSKKPTSFPRITKNNLHLGQQSVQKTTKEKNNQVG